MAKRQTTLLPELTVGDVLDELRIRAAANRKEAKYGADEGLTIHNKVCQRTAMELERLITWIEYRGSPAAT